MPNQPSPRRGEFDVEANCGLCRTLQWLVLTPSSTFETQELETLEGRVGCHGSEESQVPCHPALHFLGPFQPEGTEVLEEGHGSKIGQSTGSMLDVFYDMSWLLCFCFLTLGFKPSFNMIFPEQPLFYTTKSDLSFSHLSFKA